MHYAIPEWNSYNSVVIPGPATNSPAQQNIAKQSILSAPSATGQSSGWGAKYIGAMPLVIPQGVYKASSNATAVGGDLAQYLVLAGLMRQPPAGA